MQIASFRKVLRLGGREWRKERMGEFEGLPASGVSRLRTERCKRPRHPGAD
jgi:hypothetical protein